MSKMKKLLSILVVLALLVSSVSVLGAVNLFAAETVATEDIVYWDGTTATGIAEGSGTKDDPWIITTGAELAYAVTWNDDGAYATIENYFVLGNDIYLNELDKINWTTGAVADGYTAKSWITTQTSFYATIDGQGYSIYGMYYNGTSDMGLIPKFSGGAISNICIDYAYLSGKRVGAFLGTSNWYKNAALTYGFTNCCVGQNVTIIGTGETGGFAGRPIQKSYSSLTLAFENCYSLATVSSSGTYGGFWGDQWNQAAARFKFVNCYSRGSFAGRTTNSFATHTNCYSEANNAGFSGVTVLTAANMQGKDVFTNAEKMANLNVDDTFVATEGYPILRVFNKEYPVNYHITESESESLWVDAYTTVAEMEVTARAGYTFGGFYADADFAVALNNSDKAYEHSDIYVKWTANGYDGHNWDGNKVKPTLGTGTESNPFLIYSPEELAWSVTYFDDAGDKHFALKNDIYINDVSTDNWYSAANVKSWMTSSATAFHGVFEGNGFVVYGLYYNGTSNSSLFPKFNGGTVKNVGVEKAYLKGANVAGIFTGLSWLYNTTTTIENCYVGADVTIIGSNYAGGLISHWRYNKGTVKVNNCYSLASVTATGTNPAGGIIGDAWYANITANNCYTNMLLHGRPDQDKLVCTNCYQVNDGEAIDGITNVTAANMQGKDVFLNPDKMPNLNSDGAFSATTGYPVLIVFRDDKTTVECNITEGKTIEYDVFSDSILSEITEPTRYGYDFVGFYADAALTDKLEATDTIGNLGTIYTKWELAAVEQFTNTYDEAGYEFTVVDSDTKPENKGGGNYKATTANINAKFSTGNFSQYDAFVAEGAGVDGSNAMKVTFVESYNYGYPTAFIIYDAEGNRFTPEPNSQYRISLKYKVNVLPATGTETKDLNIVLRSTRTSGNANSSTRLSEAVSTDAYELPNGVYQYGIFNDETINRGATTDGWVTEDLIFTTNSTTNPLYIAVVTDQFDNWWAKDIDICIDDITVQSMFIPEDLDVELGDVNVDGKVNVLDLIRLKKMSLGTSKVTWCGDINGDYDIAGALDITTLCKILLDLTPTVPATKNDRTLVWSDEFNGTDLNSNFWGFRQNMNTGGIYDNTKNHAFVADGNMNLRVTKNAEDYVLPQGLTTRGKMSFKYGYLEVRAKLPYSQGAWPSIWMQAYDAYGYERDNVYNPEIDILEVFSSTDTLKCNIIKHYTEENGGKDEQYDKNKDKMYYTFKNAENLSQEYHTYGFEWDETGMKFYVDDVLYNTISFEEDRWETWFGSAYFNDSVNHFKDAFFSLNINNEIFHSEYTASEEGDWAANYTIQDGSPLPEYSIDYVRLYQKSGEQLSLGGALVN